MDKIVSAYVSVMLECKVIDEQQKEVMVYGLDLLFSSIVSLLSFIFLGLCLDKGMQTFWLLIVFIPLQSFGGGYHCQTHLRCWILMMVGYLVAMFVLVKLPIIVLWSGALAGGYSFLKIAPIENPKATFGKTFRRKMQKIVVGIYIVALSLAVISMVYRVEWNKTVLVAVILSAFSIVSAQIKFESEKRI